MQNDWRGHPAWAPIQAMIGAVGVIFSLFVEMPTLLKIVLVVATLVFCVYALFGKQITNPGTLEKSSQVNVSLPKPVDTGDKSHVQSAQIVHHPLASPPENATRLKAFIEKASEHAYARSPAPENIAPTVTEKPGNADSAQRTEAKSSSLSWKDRFAGVIGCAIIYGIPGVLLFRSGVPWQHIVGIVLLILLVTVVFVAMLPQRLLE